MKEFYLGISSGGRKSFRDVKHYRRRKRWLAVKSDVHSAMPKLAVSRASRAMRGAD